MRRLPAWLDDAVPLLAPLDRDALPRVISRAEAMRRSVADHVIDRHVARGRWQLLCPGIYLTAGAPTWRDLLDAAMLHGGSGAVISAAAALREYGFGSVPDGDGVLLLVARHSGARPCGQIRVRRTSRLPRAEPRLGPSLAPPGRAVADAAREMLKLSDVRAVVTEAVRRDLATVDELSAELAAGRRNGSRLLRLAVDDVGLAPVRRPRRRPLHCYARPGWSASSRTFRSSLQASATSPISCGESCAPSSRSTAWSITTRRRMARHDGSSRSPRNGRLLGDPPATRRLAEPGALHRDDPCLAHCPAHRSRHTGGVMCAALTLRTG